MKFTVGSVIENLDAGGLAEGEPEITRVSAEGHLKALEEGVLLSYTEVGEGGRVASEITVLPSEIRLSRRGAVVFDAIFREGEENSGIYAVGPYSFDTTVRTKKIRGSLSKAGGELSIFYTMNIGGQDKSVRLTITAEPV